MSGVAPEKGGDDVDRLLWHWPTVLRAAQVAGNEWARNFARSIARQARRPDWRPSPKQLRLMGLMVAETCRHGDLFGAESNDAWPDDFEVFE